MNKRMILALVFSLLILIIYPYYLQIIGIKPQSRGKITSLPPEALHKEMNDTVSKNDTVKESLQENNDTVNDMVLANKYIKLQINTNSGVLKEVVYKREDKPINLYPLQHKGLGLFMPTVSTVSFAKSTIGPSTIMLKSPFCQRKYHLKKYIFETIFKNEKAVVLFIPREFKLSYRDRRYIRLVFKSRGKTFNLKASSFMKKKGELKDIDWFALSFRYYSLLVDPLGSVTIETFPQRDKEGFFLKILSKSDNWEIKNYIGPNSEHILSQYNRNWLSLLDYGMISNFVKRMLQWFYNIFGSYGWAIIILALLFNFLFMPLTFKSFKSMKQMQKLQPEIQALREKYKDDPQAMNKEMLVLYKKYGVNPMSGCLPMLLQLPIFIALYNTLMRSYELKTASFLWIRDLSQPDKLFTFSQSLPFIGKNFNLLPILMAILMYIQQKTSPTSKAASPTLWFLPLIFGFIFYKFPAGLVLYWFTNSLFMLWLQMARK